MCLVFHSLDFMSNINIQDAFAVSKSNCNVQFNIFQFTGIQLYRFNVFISDQVHRTTIPTIYRQCRTSGGTSGGVRRGILHHPGRIVHEEVCLDQQRSNQTESSGTTGQSSLDVHVPQNLSNIVFCWHQPCSSIFSLSIIIILSIHV